MNIRSMTITMRLMLIKQMRFLRIMTERWAFRSLFWINIIRISLKFWELLKAREKGFQTDYGLRKEKRRNLW